MDRWYLTAQFPSYPASMRRAFYETASAEVAEDLAELFRTEYGQPKGHPIRTRFAVVAKTDLSSSESVRYAEEMRQVGKDAQHAVRWTGDLEYPAGVRGKLARWYDRAHDWIIVMAAEQSPTSIPARRGGSAAADQPTGVDTPVTLKEFMGLFCTPLGKTLLDSRIRSLQGAARRGQVHLPKSEGQWTSGQSKNYRPSAEWH